MLEFEQLMRGFLWCQGEMRKVKAKVAWEDVCFPKREGGLGIRRLEGFNKALISTHIWSLLLRKESLWVKWIHTYKLNGCTLWEIPLRGKMSWGWRKILQLMRLLLVGCGTSKYPMLANLAVPNLSNASDGLLWRHISNDESNFLVAKAWECIRPRANDVDWFHVVWFSHQIPRHAIHLWLVMRCKLKTQDMIRQWDDWNHMKSFIGIPNFPSDLSSIVDFLIPLAKMRSARSVVAKLVFAASIYGSSQASYVQVQKDEECPDDYSSLEASCIAYWSLSSVMHSFMDLQGSLVHVIRGLEAGWLGECSPRAVLLFHSPSNGLEQVLERGPWIIRNSPFILNKWTPNVSLMKNEVTKVPVWIKLRKIPLVSYSEDGLSLITTQIGKPIMFDAFTSSMCNESWGQISFARALVEISAKTELKKGSENSYSN
ncbi:hypothetical protein Tco_1248157 [Tanacetum coccineum]